MSTTSIRVSTELRDRVSRMARQRGVSQQAYLDQLLRDAEETEFWRQMAQTSAADYAEAVAADHDVASDDYDREEQRLVDEER